MIVARKIRGFFGKFRQAIRIVLLLLYLVVPWLKWGDRPLILLDIAHRKFYLPGAVFWPQDNLLLLLLMITLGLSLFLFTSLMGRLWCGWACPQTVYTELFDAIGRLVSPRFGKASQKSWEKVVLYSAWFLTSMVLTFHFIAYFTGAYTMLADLGELGASVFTERTWPYFLIAASGLFYFDLAIFRHNFCVYVCPYARFQSVMLDRDSVVIAYDSHRGEPRRGKKVKTESEAKQVGDCTNCTKCVQVCPTGIDIRNGLQVACINCAHCVDACAEEMAKFDKPSLVDYSSMRFFEDRKKAHIIRPRTVIYTLIYTLVIGTLLTFLWNRVPLYMNVTLDRNIPPMVAETNVRNVYQLKLGNIQEEQTQIKLLARPRDGRASDLIQGLHVLGTREYELKANSLQEVRLILEGNVSSPPTQEEVLPIEFIMQDAKGEMSIVRKTLFTIPAGSGK